MNPELLSSLYILGEQSVTRGRDIVICCTFAEAIDVSRLYPAFEKFIRARPLFRQRLREKDGRFRWEEFSDDELEALLFKEKNRIAVRITREELDRDAEDASIHLPICIHVLDQNKLAFTFDHSVLTGSAAYYWVDDWLQFFSYSDETIPPLPPQPQLKHAGGLGAMMRGYLSCLVYIARLFRALGESRISTIASFAGERVIDKPRFASRTHEYSLEESVVLLRLAKEQKVSVSEYFLEKICQELFAAKPEAQQIAVSLPYDIGPFTTGFTRNIPGNFTGSMILIIRRAEDLREQIIRQMTRLRKNLRYWLARFFSSMLPNKTKVLQSFQEDARLSPMKRNVFSRLTCAASNVGTITLRPSIPPVSRLSGSGRTQTIYIGMVNFEGRITLECMIATDIYREDEVFPMFDALSRNLVR